MILDLSIDGGSDSKTETKKSTNDDVTDENKKCARLRSKDPNCNTGCVGPRGRCCVCNKMWCGKCIGKRDFGYLVIMA